MPTNVAINDFADLQYNINSLNMSNDLRYYTRSVETPDWIIAADEIFSSTIDGDAQYAKSHMCYDVEFMMSHDISGDITSKFVSASGALRGAFVVVYMPSGPYVTAIKKSLANGAIIKEVDILKMSVIAGDKTPVRHMAFYNCIICNYKECKDVIKFDFRFNKHSDTFSPFDQSGQAIGNQAVTIDWQKWLVTDEAAS